jgi:hypothetical protein
MVPEEAFVVEFLAYLRLHNRSEKRHVKNKEQCQNTTWKIFDSVESIKLENTSNFNFSGSRGEKVKFPIKIKNEIKYTDAKYLGKIIEPCIEKHIDFFVSKRVNIKKEYDGQNTHINLLSLWYLLFGCEVIRNPAALIHQNMVLDLEPVT